MLESRPRLSPDDPDLRAAMGLAPAFLERFAPEAVAGRGPALRRLAAGGGEPPRVDGPGRGRRRLLRVAEGAHGAELPAPDRGPVGVRSLGRRAQGVPVG